MTLRVDWLQAPLLTESEVARSTAAHVVFSSDPVRGELVVGIGRARDASGQAATGLAALAAAVAAAPVDAHAEGGANVEYGGALWIGAAPFDPARANGGVFGEAAAARWVLPRVAFRVMGGNAVCAVAGASDAGEARRIRDETLAAFRERDRSAAELGAVEMRPQESAAAFRRRVSKALEAIRRGDLQKVVLARACHARAEGYFEAGPVLERLARAEPDAVRFSVPVAGGRMIGATPERLLRVDGERVRADALAGSAARAPSPELDSARAAGLLESKKDQEEHAWVRDAIHAALRPRLADLDAPEAPGVLSTGGLHHLHTPFCGRRAAAGVLELAAALQPTPAVAGAPTAAALAWLRAHESLARGCYAGPIGWAGRDGQGALAVALRCALLREREAFVFAGAGIVAGSEPDAELAETRLKMRAIIDALVEL